MGNPRPHAREAARLREILDLETDPVAVFLIRRAANADLFFDWPKVRSHRYCQALMEARRGRPIHLEPEELACPAAAAAFGFKPLPGGLARGDGLVGFGIVREPATGHAMFEGMPTLESDSISGLALAPLAAAPRLPDVIVVEGTPEQLMWLLLADLEIAGGRRRHGNTAVLQATCVDATVIPFVEQRLNFGLGCYGCRDATDLSPTETVLGFPGGSLDALVAALEYLATKAIPRSRAKGALAQLQQRETVVDLQ